MELFLEIARTIVRWFKRKKNREDGRDARRIFTRTQQVAIWTRQDGLCLDCGGALDWRFVIFHHIKPWHEAGKTVIKNGVALCPTCHKLRTFAHQLSDAEAERSSDGIVVLEQGK